MEGVRSNWKLQNGGVGRFIRINLIGLDGMKKKISEYRDLGRKYIDITKKINEIEERKKESLAKRIWESNE